jgi:hypothetical protein
MLLFLGGVPMLGALRQGAWKYAAIWGAMFALGLLVLAPLLPSKRQDTG